MNDQKIVIIDYGMGNLRSVQNKYNRLGAQTEISADITTILEADKLVLPGVGNFAKGMHNLKEMGLVDILNKRVMEEKTPIHGICLGMQLFTRYSEEGSVDGLGWIDAQTLKFDFSDQSKDLKVPHMGWNNIYFDKKSQLTENIEIENEFYFVHSYYVKCNDPNDSLTSTDYGIKFTSSIQKENIFGTQFHPEKSHDLGAEIIKNFISI